MIIRKQDYDAFIEWWKNIDTPASMWVEKHFGHQIPTEDFLKLVAYAKDLGIINQSRKFGNHKLVKEK